MIRQLIADKEFTATLRDRRFVVTGALVAEDSGGCLDRFSQLPVAGR